VLPSAQSQIAGESKGSRWNKARVNLVMPIGVIVAVAIVCVVVAVLTSAQRADEFSFNHEQRLIWQAIADRGERSLHVVESTAQAPHAKLNIRDTYDPQWVEERVGRWLETFFNDDVVVIVDADDRIALLGANGNGKSTLTKLLTGRLDAKNPSLNLLTRQHEKPAAIYIWGIYARGAIAGAIPLALEKAWTPLYRKAPLLARANLLRLRAGSKERAAA